MSTRTRDALAEATETPLDLSHLRRETRTALELAVVALAPMEMIDRLAGAAGLFEALIELPRDSPPAIALIPKLLDRARSALMDWNARPARHLSKAKA